MSNLKKIFPLALLLATTFSHAQYTDQINTNRPGQSQSAFAVGESVFQIESGVYGIKEKHDVLNYSDKGFGLDLALRYGAFLEELEFMLDTQYQFDDYSNALDSEWRNGFRKFTFGAKYLIYDPNKNYDPKVNLYSWKANHKFKWRNLIPAIAIYGGVNFVGKNNPYTFPGDGISPKLVAITHNHFGKWVWINNFIADKITTDYPSLGIISTFTRGFNEKWSGFLEFQGYSSDYYADFVTRIGAAHLLTDTMQVDASLTGNFKDTPSIYYASVGFSWRFDANYRDILLAGKGEREDEYNAEMKKKKEEMKKKKEERKAAKNNKRLDEMEAPVNEQQAPVDGN